MQKKMMVRAMASIFGLGLSGVAGASGFQLLEQNASGLGNAYAGSAAVGENASTVFYNPAAMTKLKGVNVSAGASLIKPSYKFSDEGSSNAPAAKGTNGGDAGGVAALPNAYASWQVSDKVFAGLGVGSPFGLKTEYDNDWVGRFQSTTFDIKTYNINPSMAVQATESVSFGFGVNYQRMEAFYKRQAGVAYPPGSNAALNAMVQGTSVTLDATSEAWGWNAGTLVKLGSNMDLGFSYRSKVFHRLEGTLSSTNQLVSPDTHAKADITLPDTYILSIVQRLDENWEILGDVSRTNWSSVDKVAIDRANGSTAQTLDARFRDTWRFALGGTYKVNSAWKWKYGLAYDQSPVRSTEERLVSLPDNNRYWLSTGVQWQMDKASVLDVGAAYLYIPESTVAADHRSKGQGNVVGSYDGSIVILGMQYSVRF